MATNSKEKQREYDAKRRGKRARGWAGILYEDSAAPDAMDQLKDLHMEVLVSPLHDQDTDGAGNPKKPHRHVLLMFPNAVPATKAKAIWKAIGAVPEKDGHGNMRQVDSMTGYARYLVHMDDHDKHRYAESDIIELGGADWNAIALGTSDAKLRLQMEIEDFIYENRLINYAVLMRHCRKTSMEWYRYASQHTLYFKELMRSMEYEARTGWVTMDNVVHGTDSLADEARE